MNQAGLEDERKICQQHRIRLKDWTNSSKSLSLKECLINLDRTGKHTEMKLRFSRLAVQQACRIPLTVDKNESILGWTLVISLKSSSAYNQSRMNLQLYTHEQCNAWGFIYNLFKLTYACVYEREAFKRCQLTDLKIFPKSRNQYALANSGESFQMNSVHS